MAAMPTFHDVLRDRLSRRSLLTGGLAAAGLGWLGPVASAKSPLVAFIGVPVSSADTLVVPRPTRSTSPSARPAPSFISDET